MLILGHRPQVGEIRPDVAHPTAMWAWRHAADLQPGWRLMLPDGRVGTVRERPELSRLGKVAVPLETTVHDRDADVDPEVVFLHAMKLVRTRTVGEELAYLDAVDMWAAARAAEREGMQ